MIVSNCILLLCCDGVVQVMLEKSQGRPDRLVRKEMVGDWNLMYFVTNEAYYAGARSNQGWNVVLLLLQ